MKVLSTKVTKLWWYVKSVFVSWGMCLSVNGYSIAYWMYLNNLSTKGHNIHTNFDYRIVSAEKS